MDDDEDLLILFDNYLKNVQSDTRYYEYEDPNCWHQWKLYVGLNEIYEYCLRCDAKREKRDEK